MKKAAGYLSGLRRRSKLLDELHRFDAVWIHREIAPLYADRFIRKLFTNSSIPVFFEFDDAVWLENYSAGNSRWAFLKSYDSALELMKKSTVNVAGNPWLQEQAHRYNPSSELLPTVVNTENGHHLVQDQDTDKPRIGWTGSHSTVKYLEAHFPTLQKVYDETPFELVVISDQAPSTAFPDMVHIPWSKESESEDLLQMHIGIMPLPNEEWVKGKCGFKLIQYMAQGIVPVADDLGENQNIITNDENGLLCNCEADWIQNLTDLLRNHERRKALAAKCRPHIIANYSVQSQRDKFLHLLETNLDLNVNN